MIGNVSIPTTLCDSALIWRGYYENYGGHDHQNDLVYARHYARVHAPDIPYSHIAGLFTEVQYRPGRGWSAPALPD